MKTYIFAAATLLAAAASAGIPVEWTSDAYRIRPLAYECYHGETLDMRASLTAYGAPLDLRGKTARLWWQTNGMGQAWFSAPASVIGTNTLAATFSGANDGGADAVTGYIGIEGENYRASFALRLRPSPGFTPNVLPLPTNRLDFAAIEVLNAPYWTKAESDARYLGGGGGGVTALAVTNIASSAAVTNMGAVAWAKAYTDEHGGGVSALAVTNIASGLDTAVLAGAKAYSDSRRTNTLDMVLQSTATNKTLCLVNTYTNGTFRLVDYGAERIWISRWDGADFRNYLLKFPTRPDLSVSTLAVAEDIGLIAPDYATTSNRAATAIQSLAPATNYTDAAVAGLAKPTTLYSLTNTLDAVGNIYAVTAEIGGHWIYRLQGYDPRTLAYVGYDPSMRCDEWSDGEAWPTCIWYYRATGEVGCSGGGSGYVAAEQVPTAEGGMAAATVTLDEYSTAEFVPMSPQPSPAPTDRLIRASETNAVIGAAAAAIDHTLPHFSNEVLAVGLNIDTNAVAAINAMAEFPIDPTTGATTLGAIIAALAASVAWLKRNKADASVIGDINNALDAINGENS